MYISIIVCGMVRCILFIVTFRFIHVALRTAMPSPDHLDPDLERLCPYPHFWGHMTRYHHIRHRYQNKKNCRNEKKMIKNTWQDVEGKPFCHVMWLCSRFLFPFRFCIRLALADCSTAEQIIPGKKTLPALSQNGTWIYVQSILQLV